MVHHAVITDFRFTKVKHQYDLKLQEVEHLKDRLEQGSHHQQLEEVNALKDSISEFLCHATKKVAGYYVIPSEILSVRPYVRPSAPPPFFCPQLLLQF